MFLLEHKSRQDLGTHRQFLGCQTGLYMHWNFPILPVLVYQGRAMEWRLPLDFQGFLKGFDGELKRLFGENVLNFRYKLLNLRKLDIKKRARGLTSRPILFILQNIWDLDEKIVKELFSLSQKASLKDRKLFMDRATDYIRQYDPKFSWKLLREIEKTVTLFFLTSTLSNRIFSDFKQLQDSRGLYSAGFGGFEGLKKTGERS